MIIHYDRRGHSRSTGSNEPYCLDDQIIDIKSIMDALEIKKASFLASSSGGVIGLGFLNKYPEMVELMVVHEPTIGIADTGVAFLVDVQLDFERLAKFKEKLILGVGEYSIDSLPYEAVKSICAYLDMSYEIFAGGHSGSMTHPVRFYQKLNSLLQETDFYK